MKIQSEVNKAKLMRQLLKQAEIMYSNSSDSSLRIDAYLSGALDLFRKLALKRKKSDKQDSYI